jgi:hypothetical protein
VRLWEFSHAQPVSVPRPSGTFAKVTRIRFHGNKFGVSDGKKIISFATIIKMYFSLTGDGRLSLWQIGANTQRPFYVSFFYMIQDFQVIVLHVKYFVLDNSMPYKTN